jgi:hypothetical protein
MENKGCCAQRRFAHNIPKFIRKGERSMDKRTTGIIATVATTLLCGCPGLLALCFGSISAVAGMIPGADIDIGGRNDPAAAITMGLVALCLGVIGVAVPVVVGFVTLRNKPAPAAEAVITTPPTAALDQFIPTETGTTPEQPEAKQDDEIPPAI